MKEITMSHLKERRKAKEKDSLGCFVLFVLFYSLRPEGQATQGRSQPIEMGAGRMETWERGFIHEENISLQNSTCIQYY